MALLDRLEAGLDALITHRLSDTEPFKFLVLGAHALLILHQVGELSLSRLRLLQNHLDVNGWLTVLVRLLRGASALRDGPGESGVGG